jgi:hypothetical protein
LQDQIPIFPLFCKIIFIFLQFLVYGSDLTSILCKTGYANDGANVKKALKHTKKLATISLLRYYI